MYYTEGGETLEQIAQRGGKCPIPGNIHVRLDGDLSNLIQLKICRFIVGGLD